MSERNDFDQSKHDGPWWSGTVKCSLCGAEHEAVFPIANADEEVTGLECTECHVMACDAVGEGEVTDEPPGGYMLLLNFLVDADGYSDRDRQMFTLGFEFAQVCNAMTEDEEVVMPIHRENQSRIRVNAARFGRKVSFEEPPSHVAETIDPDSGATVAQVWMQLTIHPR